MIRISCKPVKPVGDPDCKCPIDNRRQLVGGLFANRITVYCSLCGRVFGVVNG